LTQAAIATAGGVLTTGPVDRTGHAFSCLYVNVGKKPVTVTTEVLTITGTLEFGETDSDVPPGMGHGTAYTGSAPRVLCRFSIEQGGKSSLRALACVYESSTTAGACINSIEAR
jgi:hypothetical protein